MSPLPNNMSNKQSIDWFACPFCGNKGLESEYSSVGTTLYCAEGCHGSFTFPAFESEVETMWTKTRKHPTFKELSYPELEKLRQQISAHMQTIYHAWAQSEQQKYQRNCRRYHEKKLIFEKEILPKIKEYLVNNLKEGAIIKVKGARDGKGLRQFLSFCDNGIECRQISIQKMLTGAVIESLGQITQHMFDKVTHVKKDGKFIKIRDLIDK